MLLHVLFERLHALGRLIAEKTLVLVAAMLDHDMTEKNDKAVAARLAERAGNVFVTLVGLKTVIPKG